jgi:hypothetical protein
MSEDAMWYHSRIKVSSDEVVRHFLRKQQHKSELKGINIGDLSLTEAERVCESRYEEIARRMQRCKSWLFCSVEADTFELLKALPTQTWQNLSKGSLAISDIASNLPKAEGYTDTMQKVLELKKLVATEQFDSRIILESDSEGYTVLDGTCRAVALTYHFVEYGFSPILAYVGSGLV